MGETGANFLEAEVSQWVRNQNCWYGNLCFRNYPIQDDRPHMEKADSRESLVVTHKIKAQVKMPGASNTMSVAKYSDASIEIRSD